VQFDGKILDIEIPLTLSLEVAQTVRSPSQPTAPCAARRAWPKRARAAQDPGEKGNTAQGATKPATLETGAEIQVPLFITTGELVRVEIPGACQGVDLLRMSSLPSRVHARRGSLVRDEAASQPKNECPAGSTGSGDSVRDYQ
jgi:hypothetical protein